MHDLTPTDRKLLTALQNNARASVTELAGRIGVSRATVQTSMDKLQRTGVIKRYTVEVSAQVDPAAIRAVISIEVRGKLTSAIVKALRSMPEVTSLHSTNGAWDLVAQIETTSLPDFDSLLMRMREVPGILNSETSLLLTAFK